MRTILLSAIICIGLSASAQPYIDIVSAKKMVSPDLGVINRNKNHYSLSYSNISLSVPLGFRPISGIALLNPFFEQWQLTGDDSRMSYKNFVLACSFADTVSNHRWQYAITPVIRMKNLLEGGTSHVQWGLAGLAIFHPDHDLALSFGAYFNQYYFGPFFMPLLGINWRINDCDKLFGVLPGSLTYEHKVTNHFYWGGSFRAMTNAFADGAGYFRIDDNELAIFADTYLGRHLVLNAAAGHSIARKLSTGEKGVFVNNLYANDNIHFQFGIAYRLRLKG